MPCSVTRNHPLETEGAAERVLGETPAAGDVIGVDPDGMVDAEPGMPPAEHLWGTDPGGPPDFDDDGMVGITDFLELLANWGPCP